MAKERLERRSEQLCEELIFTQWALSMTRAWTQDLSILNQALCL